MMVTSGSFGDVNPFVGLALDLQARGHRPVIVSAPVWRTRIEEAGIECETFETGWDIVGPGDDVASCLDTAFLTKRISESYNQLASRLRSDDVLVSLTMIGLGPIVVSPLIAEVLGIPWVAVVLEPLSFFSVYEPIVLPPVAGYPPSPSIGPAVAGSALWWWRQIFNPMRIAVAALRRELSLPQNDRRPCLDDLRHADLVLALFSGFLARPQPDWPPKTILAGFVTYDGHTHRDWPVLLEEFINGGAPPIVFTFSSDALLAPDGDFWAKCVYAANAVHSRAVIVGLTLSGQPAQIVRNGNSEACFVRSASFGQLFPRASAIVHHGGIGTTALALRAGKPMLVIPGDYAQPDIAARLNRLNVARVIPRPQFTGARAAADLQQLLSVPAYGLAAAQAASVLAKEDGARAAGNALESLMACRYG